MQLRASHKAFAVAAVLLFVLALSASAQQTFEGCKGTINDLPLLEDSLELVQQVPNGKKYTAPYDGHLFYVVVVNGSAYEMGYAEGQLLKNEINAMIPKVFDWFQTFLQTNISAVIRVMPKFIKNWFSKTAIKLGQQALNLNYYITLPYTPARWDEEMQGMADASGADVWNIRQINLIPELLKASCSILGAYQNATQSTKLLHLRTLDWEAHAPQSEWPTIVVYHPTEAGSVPFANIAWPAFIGTLTGYNSKKVGVGERLGGASPSEMTRLGTPWTYVLRDGLQFSKTQDQYIQYLKDAHKTCAIYLGVGGENFFNIVEYAYAYLRVYDWNSWHHDPNHPTIPYVLWKAYPDDTPCFSSIINAFYGKLTPEIYYRYVAPLGLTGDSQVAVMDYATDDIYCMYPNPVTSEPGYNCPPIKIPLGEFFKLSALE
jgi:isopenicillin-N N-acyltransferase like protein